MGGAERETGSGGSSAGTETGAGCGGLDRRYPRAAETVAVISNAEIAPGVFSVVTSREPIGSQAGRVSGQLAGSQGARAGLADIGLSSGSQAGQSAHVGKLAPFLVPAPAAGQFFMLRARPSGVFLGRPISVYRSDSASITFLILQKGEGTAELCALRTGDKVDLVGPIGNTFRSPFLLASIAEESRGSEPAVAPSTMGAQRLGPDGFPVSAAELALIAALPAKPRIAVLGGGIGVAPVAGFALDSSIETGLEAGSFDFYAAFRSGSYALEGIADRANRLFVTTEDGSVGVKGMLTAVFNPADYDLVYACGPTPMLKYVKESCSGRLAYVSLERRMACGAGACLGCTIETTGGNRRCCVDGPVFPASEVLF